MSRLEWMLASRYVKTLRPRSARLFLIPVPVVLVAIVAKGLQLYLARARRATFANPAWFQWEHQLRNGWLAAAVAALALLFLIALIRRYTIFTSISTYGLFLGSAALVVVLSIMSGFEQDLKLKILGANAHVLVSSPDQSFTDYGRVAARVSAVKGVESVTPYLSDEVMISSQSNLSGVILKGVDPTSAAAVTDLGRNLEQGSLDNLLHPENVRDSGLSDDDLRERPGGPGAAPEPATRGSKAALDPASNVAAKPALVPVPAPVHDRPRDDLLVAPTAPGAGRTDKDGAPRAAGARPAAPAPNSQLRKVLPGVLVGRELAKNLRVFVGDDVNLISPMGDIGPTGSMPRSRPFRVVGIFYSGMYEYDTKHIYMSIAAAQKFLGKGDEVSGVEVRVKDPDHPRRVVAAIQAALGGPGPQAHYEVQDWQELNRSLFSALKIEKVAMFIGLSFIILVAGFAIIANGIMLVREKERDIAMLKSMGSTDRSILKTFLFVGAYTGLIGIGFGIATGVLTCLVLRFYGITLDTDVYYIAKLPVQMGIGEIFAVFAASMSIALAATLYPALVAARLRPVEGLRYDHG